MKTYFEVDMKTFFAAYGDPLGHGDSRFGYAQVQDGYGDFFNTSKFYLIIGDEL